MKGLASTDPPNASHADEGDAQNFKSDRPEVEELTPEPDDLPFDIGGGGYDPTMEQPSESNPARLCSFM